MADNKNLPAAISPEDEALLKQKIHDITHEVIEAGGDIDVINKFRMMMLQKSMIRASKQDELEDMILAQMMDRVKNRAGTMSNQDILNYYTALEKSLENNTAKLANPEDIKVANITKNDVTINVVDGFTHEERDNMADVIKNILNSAKTLRKSPADEPITAEYQENNKDGEDKENG